MVGFSVEALCMCLGSAKASGERHRGLRGSWEFGSGWVGGD